MADNLPVLAQYSFRRSVLEKERTYTVYPDRMLVEGADVRAQTYVLGDVRRVHLKYEHTKQRGYYQCFVHTKFGRVDLRHLHWKGIGDFEDRSAAYVPFVKALGALAGVPGVRFQAGSMANFIGAIVGVPVMAGLAWLCFSLQRYGLAIGAAVMGGIALMMIGPSRPRTFDPLAPPADVLPE